MVMYKPCAPTRICRDCGTAFLPEDKTILGRGKIGEDQSFLRNYAMLEVLRSIYGGFALLNQRQTEGG